MPLFKKGEPLTIRDFGHNSFVHTKGLKERIEMTEQKELLKVLDMSGDEQGNWCCRNTNIKTCESLADLAFRLRDEAVMLKGYPWAATEVYYKAHYFEESFSAPITMVWIWFATHSKPIHWIVAALIAKESK